ncbi:MAG: hypothetical protein ACYCW6_22250 [Candidatus Xenobia bacterium]
MSLGMSGVNKQNRRTLAWEEWERTRVPRGQRCRTCIQAGLNSTYLAAMRKVGSNPTRESAAAIGRIVGDQDGALVAAGYLPYKLINLVSHVIHPVRDAGGRVLTVQSARRILVALRIVLTALGWKEIGLAIILRTPEEM